MVIEKSEWDNLTAVDRSGMACPLHPDEPRATKYTITYFQKEKEKVQEKQLVTIFQDTIDFVSWYGKSFSYFYTGAWILLSNRYRLYFRIL